MRWCTWGRTGRWSGCRGRRWRWSAACFPEVVTGALPVVYPFIVSNPGEAAQAKRRIAAVTLGHLTPPLEAAGLGEGARRLERLVDEYAQAEGLDRRRRERLARLIVEEAEASGLAGGGGRGRRGGRSGAGVGADRRLALRSQGFRGEGRAARLRAVGARGGGGAARVRRGGAGGAAWRRSTGGTWRRGRRGRRRAGGGTCCRRGGTSMRSIRGRCRRLRRTIWGGRGRTRPCGGSRRSMGTGRGRWWSTSGGAREFFRTGGEEIAQGLALMGCRPVWDEATGRVTGVEVLPPASLRAAAGGCDLADLRAVPATCSRARSR